MAGSLVTGQTKEKLPQWEAADAAANAKRRVAGCLPPATNIAVPDDDNAGHDCASHAALVKTSDFSLVPRPTVISRSRRVQA